MKRFYSLFSGGVDSTLATYKILTTNKHCHITPVFFDYGQKAAPQEASSISKLVRRLRNVARRTHSQIDACRKYRLTRSDLFRWSRSNILNGRPKGDNFDIENRNMILIAALVSVVLSDRKKKHTYFHPGGQTGLIVGFKNEHYDTKRHFANLFNVLLTKEPFFITVVTPLIAGHVRRSFHSLAKEFFSEVTCRSLLDTSWSCYFPKPNGLACGNCAACKSRTKLIKEVKARAHFKRS